MRPSRAGAEAFLHRIWLQRGIAALLLPFAWLFFLLSGARRALYRFGIFSSRRLPVPVVVIGNISVGGAGKTPLILHLAQCLTAMGCRPGIVSRGYGAGAVDAREVYVDSAVDDAGDEALLLKRRSGVPVFVGHDRAAAAHALLVAYPQCQLILCDDGLQHYALQRDLEIAVIDRRGFMNGWLLPAGPLREPPSRLGEVDACVLNEASLAIAADVPVFRMSLVGTHFTLLGDATRQCDVAALRNLRLHAFAGIGEPQRFFDHLSRLGLSFVPHVFSDHHRYCAEDFGVEADAILTTEKDAVKCLNLTQLPIWVLPVDAVLEPDLARFVLEKINGCAPA
ncbi:lipid A 4'kinase [Georgfuchsia toluolica]|uniref:Tetraacyldisaccharide 4'-kinase n=1 Tax=Georgfuchsia toluolica TaxID=424218 RepID=A0A916J4L6_9PROT|nr:tetraacyldisaccharide 4'-kinase [Georgfuchsia toluolica]CAG4883862.1 lipid A 4'kinase [Georgfuchsia toluolica]